MNVTSIGLASLAVRDLDASRHFYAGILNLPVLNADQSGELVLAVGDAHRLVLRTDSKSDLRESSRRPEATAFIVGKNPAALEAAARSLEQRGIPYERVQHTEYDSLYLRDPDGHLVELYYWPSW